MSLSAPRPADPEAPSAHVAYATASGQMIHGTIEAALESPIVGDLAGKVNLIFTSPPFPLVTKKRYGNKNGDEYLDWLKALAPKLKNLLAPDGSIVVEVGNAWEQGSPVMSTLPLEALLAFKNAGGLHLCQHIICHNPARLPSPAQWVTIKRVRLKDSYTHVWWMAAGEEPKSDNRRVLAPYGPSMKKLLRTKKYNAGKRPSGHVISQAGFLTDHGGSIAANVLDLENEDSAPPSLLKFSGTGWDKRYRAYCASRELPVHPARMQLELAAFFIEFLTEPNDLVLDPFAGSNTTGFAAQALGRRWLGVEANIDYISGSKGRFDEFSLDSSDTSPPQVAPEPFEDGEAP